MLKRISLLILFFVSYLPLFIILFIQNLKPIYEGERLKSWKEIILDNQIATICLLASLVSLVLYFIISSLVQRYGFKTPETVIKVKNTGVEYLSYLGTYIIPFIGMKFDSVNNSLATWVLILVIALIYPRTNLIYANPTLALFGYNIYKVTLDTDTDEEIVVITREKIKKKKAYRFKELTEEVFFAKKM